MSKIVYYLMPSSFCFGVKRSIDELIKITQNHSNEKIFCIHALVHNPKITDYFRKQWVQFTESLDEIKNSKSVIVFSAHGINREIILAAQQKFDFVYNLECPFVSKIYNEAKKYIQEGIKRFIYIGKQDHQEGKNVIAYLRSQWAEVKTIIDINDLNWFLWDQPFAVLSQTTLNFVHVQNLIEQIKLKYPQAILPKISDICKATYERQEVIQKYKNMFDTLVVIGGKESSNTKELYNIWKNMGKETFYEESLDQLLQQENFSLQKNSRVAVTWWASTPVEDILEVIDWYQNRWYQREILELTS